MVKGFDVHVSTIIDKKYDNNRTSFVGQLKNLKIIILRVPFKSDN